METRAGRDKRIVLLARICKVDSKSVLLAIDDHYMPRHASALVYLKCGVEYWRNLRPKGLDSGKEAETMTSSVASCEKRPE